MALKHSYSVLAPMYDQAVSGPLDGVRRKSLARLPDVNGKKILINGIGTGLDLPYLPSGASYTGTDITPLMLKRAEKRADQHDIDIRLECADSHRLPFKNDTFDMIIMHLILAVVPDPGKALQEAERVLKSNGSIYILDKFLRPGQLAPIRRGLNIILRHIATRTDVVFENVLANCNHLHVSHDEPALAGGWFRLIELIKKS
ncbi:MAG: class I SAM-dependent methyltransferase [Gammaproteobacteria bacterium]|jgi:ubiquinone/menaquinone biosynthesis C-methylase UbiE|nr:class I SAM-dependent methyltransferase [Gammaproteobacteria bacterium]